MLLENTISHSLKAFRHWFNLGFWALFLVDVGNIFESPWQYYERDFRVLSRVVFVRFYEFLIQDSILNLLSWTFLSPTQSQLHPAILGVHFTHKMAKQINDDDHVFFVVSTVIISISSNYNFVGSPSSYICVYVALSENFEVNEWKHPIKLSYARNIHVSVERLE